MFTNNVLTSTPLLGKIKKSEALSSYSFNGTTSGFAIKYVSKGKEKYLVNGEVIRVREGEFILLPSGLDYRVENETFHNGSDPLTQGICVDLNPSTLKASKHIDLQLFNVYGTPLQNLHSSQLGQSFKKLCAPDSNTSYTLVLRDLKEKLLRLLIDNLKLQENLSCSIKSKKKLREIIVKLTMAHEYVYRHYREKIKLDDIVQKIGVSKFHFNRLFRQAYSESPLDLQHRLRMEMAKEKVMEDKLSLTQIAQHLGYFDLPAFNRQFRKHWQVAPSQMEK